MAIFRSLGTLKDFLADTPLLGDFFSPEDLPGFLDRIYVIDYRFNHSPAGFFSTFWLAFDGELSVKLFGANGLQLVIGGEIPGFTFITVSLRVTNDESVLTLHNVSLTLRFNLSSLQSSDGDGGASAAKSLEVRIQGSVHINSSFKIWFSNLHVKLNAESLLGPDSGIEVQDFHVDTKCLAIKWIDSNVNRRLQQIVPNLFEQSAPVESEMTLQIIFGNPIKEIRLDWKLSSPVPRTFTLPGFNLTTPKDVRFTLLLGAENKPLSHIAFLLSIDQEVDPQIQDKPKFEATSNFAWGRNEGEEREIQNDANGKAPKKPLFYLGATVKKSLSLVLIAFDITQLKLPKFFQQFNEPIPLLDFSKPESLSTPVSFHPAQLHGDWWDLAFNLNIEEGFKFPFLNQDDGALAQWISIEKPDSDVPIKADLEKKILPIPLNVIVKLGDIQLKSKIDVNFNWETFALSISHDDGLKLVSPDGTFEPAEEHLGMKWRFKGHETSPGQFHYFTLVTKDYNYQLQQAPSSVFEVEFTQISEDPIGFAISDFVLSPKGINLTATVIDRPTRLRGLDTQFRFSGSSLNIIENQIQDFTLAGSGPLPPALVGDATADVRLQFGRRDGNLALLAGDATLKTNQPLRCGGTRFQFSVEKLGLKFVNDGKFHLYFTLTGSAQFVLGSGDDTEGALALLPNITIKLTECPLTGDARVIAKHVSFLIALPKPVSFNFLGCFELELRGIGFLPQAEVFDDDGAMLLTGQLKFAQGGGDAADSRVDLHRLYIGLPKKGSFIPRLHFEGLPLNLNFGEAFQISGTVNFSGDDNPLERGFTGEGVVQIQGLPTVAASFAFLRVREDPALPWLRAWFIYLEVRKISFMIPVVQWYIREAGLGFGYRYTIASIKAADKTNDVMQLLAELKKLSQTQGDLSKRDRWAVDIEKAGEDPRWTIALRALISQSSAAPSPLQYDAEKERLLSCAFLFDAVVALRSDLTFIMVARGWLNTNYSDYVNNVGDIRNHHLFNGFVFLSPRQKRLLANLSSNPDGKIGSHPPMPDYVQKAISKSQFSATLLLEPGLFHLELGWPNMLRWSDKIGLFDVEFRGGAIFRTTTSEIVIGLSLMALGKMEIKKEVNLKFIGVRAEANANMAYGMRYMGVLPFHDTDKGTALYGAVGMEIAAEFSITGWVKIGPFKKKKKLSQRITFAFGIEIGIVGLRANLGMRGSGTVSTKIVGKRVHFDVNVEVNKDAVIAARNITERFLDLGLEATDVQGSIPGVPAPALQPQPQALLLRPLQETALQQRSMLDSTPAFNVYETPNYSIFVVHKRELKEGYLVLLPKGEREVSKNDTVNFIPEPGFLPVPPTDTLIGVLRNDFEVTFPVFDKNPDFVLEHFNPSEQRWIKPFANFSAENKLSWKVKWEATLELSKTDSPSEKDRITLAEYLRLAFKIDEWAFVRKENDQLTVYQNDGVLFSIAAGDIEIDTLNKLQISDALRRQFADRNIKLPDQVVLDVLAEDSEWAIDMLVGDPELLSLGDEVKDARVHNPSDNSFEAAVRGAVEQFEGAPFFKHDPTLEYDKLLGEAFRENTTIYTRTGQAKTDNELTEMQSNRQAHELRGLIVQDLVADLREYVAALPEARLNLEGNSLAFQMGLVFHYKFESPDGFINNYELPTWLTHIGTDEVPMMRQRLGPLSTEPSSEESRVQVFNSEDTDFSLNPPQFQHLRHYTDANVIAITWDLLWEQRPNEACTECQSDPEHHLLHYQVRRRSLDGSEPEKFYTIKSAEVLHREPGEALIKRLKPRFQIVDHFEKNSDHPEILPTEGRSYLYTITPVDFADHLGRPLSLVATRYPNEPPPVPTDGKLIVSYRLSQENFAPKCTKCTIPKLIIPEHVEAEWTPPAASPKGTMVATAQYVLIFRREATLPIGSYGLDSTTQRPRVKSLPTSNARALPTDIKIELVTPKSVRIQTPEGLREIKTAEIPIAATADAAQSEQTLQGTGVFPSSPDPTWRPESWRVFFQTVSANGVRSALAPVQILLRMETEPNGSSNTRNLEERQPAELEWVPKPMVLPMLPPEDERAITGMAHFPMPNSEMKSFAFSESLNNILYEPHPAGIRGIRFRWNQGPSEVANYPLDLNAGYHLLELDIDAHTETTFNNSEQLAAALRTIQEVQMSPTEDLLLIPGNTLNTSQWEAWYPSTILRRRTEEQMATQGSDIAHGPWYSWRESMLEWPEWPGFTDQDNGRRTGALHPLLKKIIDGLVLELFSTSIEFQAALDKSILSPELLNDFAKNDVVLLPTAKISVKEPGKEWSIKDNSDFPAFLIRKETEQLKVYIEKIYNRYNADLQISPPIQPGNFAAFIKSTPPKSDPYGWGVLQRFGLSVTFSLRDKQTGETVKQSELLAALQQVLEVLENDTTRRHLYVELLFQPGKSIRFESDTASAGSLLAMIQLSLRPAPRQYLSYGKLSLSGPEGTSFDLILNLEKGMRCSVINQANPASGQIELAPEPLFALKVNFISELANPSVSENLREEFQKAGFALADDTAIKKSDADWLVKSGSLTFRITLEDGELRIYYQPQLLKHTIRLPFNGNADILVRGSDLPAIQVVVDLALRNDLVKDEQGNPVKMPIDLVDYFEYKEKHLIIKKSTKDLSDPKRQEIREILVGGDKLIADHKFDWSEKLEPLCATDERSSYFTVASTLVDDFSKDPKQNENDLAIQWRRFKRYAESLNSSDTEISPDLRINVPTDKNDLDTSLPTFLAWSQRFFDFSGAIEVNKTTGLGNTHAAGPWIATAYPRVTSPAYAAPDESGRLQYDHLLEDKWAHNYRYYIRPYGRYDLLWQSLRQSPALFPDPSKRPAKPALAVPDPNVGGLDVVLERTQPVAKPLVLRSGRLDEPSTAAKPAVPGATWEVIVAQHPEQALIERNQTLFRQLAFRQISFTLLRRFAFPEWIGKLQKASGYSFELTPVENNSQEIKIPEKYPEQPDHLDLGNLSEEAALSLDLPERLGAFQQGALILQWEALPYFYEHRLLLVAQTASTASSLNEVTQRDFEYRSPEPSAQWAGIKTMWEPQPPFSDDGNAVSIEIRGRQVEIPLRRFWDCLPIATRGQWISDDPDRVNGTVQGRKFSSLPDPEIVYQIVESFSGNIEVQAEFYFEPNPTISNYQLRQLGKHFLAKIEVLKPPTIERPQADYALSTVLQQITEQGLARLYDKNLIPTPTRHKIAFRDKLLLVAGVFTRADRNNILLNSVEELRLLPSHPAQKPAESPDEFLQEWYTTRAVSFEPQLPDELSAKLDFPEPSHLVLALNLSKGLSVAQIDEIIQKLEGETRRDDQGALKFDAEFVAALASIKEQATTLRNGLENELLDDVALFKFIEGAPTGRDLPEILKSQLFINEHGIQWHGPMNEVQSKALKQYRTDSDIYQTAVRPLLTAISAVVFDEPYDIPPRPRPDDLRLPSLFAIQVNYETTPRNWVLQWTGSMTKAEETALRNLPGDDDFKNGVVKLIEQIMKHPFEEIIPLGRPRPNSTLPGTFRIEIRVQPTPNWILRWTGPMTKEEEAALLALPGDNDFKQGVVSLIGEVRKDSEPPADKVYSETISFVPPRPLPGSSLPGTFAIEIRSQDSLLKWTGTMTAAEEAALRALQGDEAFTDGIEKLIKQIREFYLNRRFEEGISFAWPRVDKERLDESTKLTEINGLAGLEIPEIPIPVPSNFDPESTKRIRWHGADNLAISIDYLIARVQACLRADNPFVHAFTNLLEQVRNKGFAADFWTPRRPLQNELPEALQGNLLLGRHFLRCKGSLTDTQLQALLEHFDTEPDRASIRRLQADLQDQQALDRLYQDWFSQEPISSEEVDLDELKEVVDFPEPNSCVLIWEGTLSSDEESALQDLDGDDAFKAALKRLANAVPTQYTVTISPGVNHPTSQLPVAFTIEFTDHNRILKWTGLMSSQDEDKLRALKGDTDFQNDQDLVEGVYELIKKVRSSITVEAAPLGLDQKPRLVKDQIHFGFDDEITPKAYKKLIWTGLLFDNHAQLLRRWAQPFPAFALAVDQLLADLDNKITKEDITAARPLPEELPEILRTRLQISANQLAWIGTAPNSDDLTALDGLKGDEKFVKARNDLLDALAQPDASKGCVVAVEMDSEVRRPRQGDLPAILQTQLTIQDTQVIQDAQVIWTGRIHNEEQLAALKDLQGDEPFDQVIEEIINTLTTDKEIVKEFDLPVPVRQSIDDLPPEQRDILKDKLLIGRALIRYHGLMTIAEGEQLQKLFNSSTDKHADKHTIQRLYDASMNKGLGGKGLKIRARRGSATPSALNKIEVKTLQ